MTDTLKPCPFCGNRNVAQGASRDQISVWCFCGAEGPKVPFPEIGDPGPPIDACFAKWNQRAAFIDQSEAELTRLRALVGEAEKVLSDAIDVLDFEVATRGDNDGEYEFPAGPVLRAASSLHSRFGVERASAQPLKDIAND